MIAGTRVHDVGYRVFLLKNAMNLALPGLSTYNWDEDGRQEVIALVEGDEARVASFLKTIESKRPELAEVSSLTFEDYDGDVGRASEVAMFCTFVQLDKAIPLLLDMRDDLKAVRKTTDSTLDEIKGMREDIQPGYAMQFRQMQSDVRAIKDRLGMS
jgi:acylphosphatase